MFAYLGSQAKLSYIQRRSFEDSFAQLALETTASSQRLIKDYVLDASGVPACARLIGRKVVEAALQRRATAGRTLLRDEVATVADRIGAAQTRGEELIAKCRDLQNARMLLESRSEDLRRAQEELKALTSARELALVETKGRVASVARASVSEGDALQERMLDELRKFVKSDAEGELWGKRRFDVFSNFDAPLALAASQHIERFSEEVWRAFGDLAPHAFPVLSETRYSLHDSESYVVMDYEKLFESFKTVLRRMETAAEAHATQVREAIQRRVTIHLKDLIAAAYASCEPTFAAKKHSIENLEADVRDAKAMVEALEGLVPNDVSLYQSRLDDARALLARVEAFKAKLGASDGAGSPERHHETPAADTKRGLPPAARRRASSRRLP